MHMRRHRLTESIAMQISAATPPSSHDIVQLRVFPLREPVSGRAYSVVRLRTKSGLTGHGECVRVSPADIETARKAILGRPATSYSVTLTRTPLDGAVTTAMIDITARVAQTPAYRLLGGPTRAKVRALASLAGATITN
jgi:galactonate dehydratase